MTGHARWTLLLTLVTVVVLVALVHGWQTCDEQGGQYVRGVVWMKCVR